MMLSVSNVAGGGATFGSGPVAHPVSTNAKTMADARITIIRCPAAEQADERSHAA